MTNPSQSPDEIELEKLLDYLDTGDPAYPGRRPTAKAAIHSLVNKEVSKVLSRVGEPMLHDIIGVPTPEEYAWSIKTIDWYKNRISTIKAEYGGDQ